MKIKSFKILVLFFCICNLTLFAQDVDQVIKDSKNILKDPVSVTGSIGASSVFYRAFGIQPRRDPFYWVLNANLTFSLFNKITVPFSATFTQQDKNFSHGLDRFSQPFNQFGLSPHYKWLTVHAGHRSMEFSEYSLSGALFLGGGVEIKPEKSIVSGAAMFGRLVKGIPIGGINGIVVSLPAYERWGGGAKVKVGSENNFGELIFFKAKDDIYSIPFDTSLHVKPAENQVIEVGTKQKINKWINAEGSFAFSMFTNNLYDEITKIERFTYVNQIYDPRTSSQFNKAITGGLNFTPGKFKFGLRYKRIDPDYRSLGAIFLTNDIEEYSLNTAYTFFKNKINLSASTGIQHNNLDKIQVATSQRFIGAVNFSYNVTEHLNFSLNYSNFSSNTIAVQDIFTDSIKLVQLTQSGTGSFNYSFGKNKLKHNFLLNSTYQESGGNKQESSVFSNGTIGYTLGLTSIDLNITTSFLYNELNTSDNTNVSMGPALGIQKALFKKKMRITLNSSIQSATLNNKLQSKNLIVSTGINYIANKNNSFKLEGGYLEKAAVIPGVRGFSEYRITVGYLCVFGAKLKTRQTTSSNI